MRFVSSAILFSLVATGAAADSKVPPPNTPNLPMETGAVLSAWTQIVANDDLSVANSAIELRYVLMGTAATCDLVTVKVDSVPITNVSHRGTMTEADPNDKTIPTYSVQICSVPLAAGSNGVTINDSNGIAMIYNGADNPVEAKLPGPAQLGARTQGAITGIAMGDSGCRGDEDGQDCAKEWVLPRLAQNAADQNPDFVLHVGDYHYFYENNYQFWSVEHGGNRIGYFLQEFLIPAGPLLRKSPWIIGRGNHERCTGQWVGNGWHLLFDPRPLPNGDPCTTASSKGGLPGIPATWAVDLAPTTGTVDPFRFFIIDNVNAGNLAKAGYEDAANAGAMFDGAKVGWISHYPPIKLAQWGGRWHYAEPAVLNDIQNGFDGGSSPCKMGSPCIPSIIFAGHQHFYQELIFDALGVPMVSIVGNGGVAISANQQPGEPKVLASSCTGDFSAQMPFEGATTATVNTAQYFGYLKIRRDSSTDDPTGWDRENVWIGVDKNPDVSFDPIGDCPTNE